MFLHGTSRSADLLRTRVLVLCLELDGRTYVLAVAKRSDDMNGEYL